MGKLATCQIKKCEQVSCKGSSYILCSSHWGRVPDFIKHAVWYWVRRKDAKAWGRVQQDAVQFAGGIVHSRWTDGFIPDYGHTPRYGHRSGYPS